MTGSARSLNGSRTWTVVALAFGAALHLSAGAVTPPTGRKSGNLVIESGRDVGPCPAGGSLGYPPEPYKGQPGFLVAPDGPLAGIHRTLTAREAPWVRRLNGPAGANRLYTDARGARVLVFDGCEPHDCGTHGLVGARLLDAPHTYGLQVVEDGRVHTLGMFDAPMRAAIACLQAANDCTRAGAAFSACSAQR